MHDLAWAEVEEEEGQHSLDARQAPVDFTVSSTMYFRQPYDGDANYNAHQSVVGATSTLLYRSMNSPLLEALDVGFRGMSGAIAIDSNNLVVGMMSRPKPIRLDIDRPVEDKGALHSLVVWHHGCDDPRPNHTRR